jgi:predicted HTH transcriptional regulator
LEDQHIEWKESWHDKYLSVIGGFANTDGGVLEIGRRDSCNGKYYARSGSTTHELSGNALDEFMLRKQGRAWDNANAFFRSGQIEAWGRGVEKMNEVMIGFSTDANIVENDVENAGNDVENEGNDVENTSMSEMQAKIIELMKDNPKVSAKTIAERVGITARNVQTHIQSLKAAGLVERVGPAKGGHWVVKDIWIVKEK